MGSTIILLLVATFIVIASGKRGNKETCYNKFEYLLKKLVQLDNVLETIRGLEDTISSLTTTSQGSTQKLVQLEQDKTTMLETIGGLEDTISSLTTTSQGSTQKLVQLEQDKTTMLETIGGLEDTISSLTTTSQGSTQKLVQLEQDKTTMLETIGGLEDTISSLTTTSQGSTQKLVQLEQDKTTMLETIGGLEDTISSLTTTSQGSTQKLVQLEQDKTTMLETIGGLEDTISSLTTTSQGSTQKLVQLEQDKTTMLETIGGLEDTISSLTTNLQGNSLTIGDLKETVHILQNCLLDGASYVRWGRTTCPTDRGAELVYTGQVGGGYYYHYGSGTQYLCLPSDPTWNDYVDGEQSVRNLIYGAEYETIDGTFPSLHNQNIPCAVCRTPRTNILTIPGRNECYNGWVLEYDGYLMSERHNHIGNKEYVCLDSDPEIIPGGAADSNGALFYNVEARCGSLECPPYVNGRELTCAVCSYSPTD